MSRERTKAWLCAVIVLAIGVELVNIVADPHGWLWRGAETAVVTLFVIGSLTLLAAAHNDRTRRK